jgi:hypothetical protein
MCHTKKVRNALSGDRLARRADVKILVKDDSLRHIHTTPLFYAVKSLFDKFEGDKWWCVVWNTWLLLLLLFASLLFVPAAMCSPVPPPNPP